LDARWALRPRALSENASGDRADHRRAELELLAFSAVNQVIYARVQEPLKEAVEGHAVVVSTSPRTVHRVPTPASEEPGSKFALRSDAFEGSAGRQACQHPTR
jgi:hypothetical protein